MYREPGKSKEFIGTVGFKKNISERIENNNEYPYLYSQDDIYIYSMSEGINFNDVFILFFGRITDIFSTNDKMDEYGLSQEYSIIGLYKKYGENFIKFIDGYFSIILYDRNLKKLYLFNDRYLNTRFYYYLDNEKIIFANSLKEVLKNITKKPQLNKKSVISYLNCGYSYSEKTFFDKIFRLTPGFYLCCNSGKAKFCKYSGLVFSRKPIKNLAAKINEYEELFSSAIEVYLKANSCVNLGCQLSGGTDTSWIYLNASKILKKRLHAYTCYYEQPLFNEITKAEQVIDAFGGIHHKILITSKDLDYLPEMIRVAEEPILSSSLPIFKLVKEASKDVDILLNGNGGDSFFGSFYPVSEVHKYMRYMPPILRKTIHLFFLFAAKFSDWERLYECEHVLRAFLPKNFYEDFYENLVSYRHFNKTARQELLNPSFFTENKINECMDGLFIREKSFFDDLINTKCVYGIMQYQLTWEDKFCQAHKINSFAPYFNKEIMDFLCSLPVEFLVRGSRFQRLTHTATQRWFQKCALMQHFPKEFVMNQNQPFDQPFHAWFEARPKVVENLFNNLMDRGWFNNLYLEKIYNEHKKQKLHKTEYCELKNHGHRIFALLALEVWCREYLDSDGYLDEYENKPLEDYLKDAK